MNFLVDDRPTIVTMLKSTNTADVTEEIKRAIKDGTDAFGFQLDIMEPDARSDDDIKRIIEAGKDKPFYVTNYRRANKVEGQSDDELAEGLLKMLDAGAALVDVFGDIYGPSPDELARNENAVKKQKQLIDEIHSRGGEVLISSHLLRYAAEDEVMDIAFAHKDRGADISKIVTEANSEKELTDNFEILLRLKTELGIPSLFLCNGTHCRSHRIMGPVISKTMFLTTHDSNKPENQPFMSEAKRIISLCGAEV